MNEQTRELRRKIALYRDHLARGTDTSEAMRYLRRIIEAEAELERIKGKPLDDRKPRGPG
jgi:hypothetical protein